MPPREVGAAMGPVDKVEAGLSHRRIRRVAGGRQHFHLRPPRLSRQHRPFIPQGP